METIRWRKKDKAELKRKVKNYNAKIKRLSEKENFPKELLPKKLSYKELKESIDTRRKFKSEIDMMNALTKRGSEKIYKSNRGLKVPEFEIKQNKIKMREINYIRDKDIKRYEEMGITDRGKKLNLSDEDTKKAIEKKIRHKHYNYKNRSKKDYEMFKKTLNEYDQTMEERNALYRKNLYKSIMSDMAGYTQKQQDELKNVLDKLTDQQIIDKYYTDINMEISFNYEPLENDTKYDSILEAWKALAE